MIRAHDLTILFQFLSVFNWIQNETCVTLGLNEQNVFFFQKKDNRLFLPLYTLYIHFIDHLSHLYDGDDCFVFFFSVKYSLYYYLIDDEINRCDDVRNGKDFKVFFFEIKLVDDWILSTIVDETALLVVEQSNAPEQDFNRANCRLISSTTLKSKSKIKFRS